MNDLPVRNAGNAVAPLVVADPASGAEALVGLITAQIRVARVFTPNRTALTDALERLAEANEMHWGDTPTFLAAHLAAEVMGGDPS